MVKIKNKAKMKIPKNKNVFKKERDNMGAAPPPPTCCGVHVCLRF